MPNSFHSERYKIFISLLRETREAKQISQTELALKLGQPQTFVSKCETGVRRLDVVELHTWLLALDVTPTAFLKSLEKHWGAHAARMRIL